MAKAPGASCETDIADADLSPAGLKKTIQDLRAQLLGKDETIAKMKRRAKQFVEKMRAENDMLKKQVEASKVQRECDSVRDAVSSGGVGKRLPQPEPRLYGPGASGDGPVDTIAGATKVEELTKELAACKKGLALAKLEAENANESYMTTIAAANARGRELRDQLDKCVSERDMGADRTQRLTLELAECRGLLKQATEDASIRENENALEITALRKTLADTRVLVQNLESERTILSTKLHETRVSTKDGQIKAQTQLHEAQLEIQDITQRAHSTSREAQRKIAETEATCTALRDQLRSAEFERDNSRKKSQDAIAKFESVQAKLAILESQTRHSTDAEISEREEVDALANAHKLEIAALREKIGSLEKGFQEQRSKRIAAKNEILTMARKLDGERQERATAIAKLQKLLTKAGSLIISCRAHDTDVDKAQQLIWKCVSKPLSETKAPGTNLNSGDEMFDKGSGRGGRRQSNARSASRVADALDLELSILTKLVDLVVEKFKTCLRELDAVCRQDVRPRLYSQSSDEGGAKRKDSQSSCCESICRVFGYTVVRISSHSNNKPGRRAGGYAQVDVVTEH